MLQETAQTHAEQLPIGLSLGDTPKQKSTSLIEREQVEGTPFWILGSKERGYFLALGHHKLCENKKTKYAVKQHLKNNQWQVIICLIGVVQEKMLYDNMAAAQEYINTNNNNKNENK